MRTLVVSLTVACLVACLAVVAAAQIEKGLVLYFPFEEGKGTTVTDKSGNGNDGKFFADAPAPEWVDGKYGKALEFKPGEAATTGKAGFVQVPDSPSISPTDAITVACWVYPKDLSHFAHVLLAHWCAGASGPGCKTACNPSCGFTLETHGPQIGGNNEVYILLNPCGAIHTKTQLKIGEWQHIAFTYDKSEGKVRIYYNGTVEGEADCREPLWDSEQPFQVAHTDRDDVVFGGIIDEVSVWNRALTAKEVQALMGGITSVEPSGKLSTSWGQIKNSY